MKKLILFLWLLNVTSEAADGFHIYAPSPTTKRLLVVKAEENDGGLSLKLAQKFDLGFPAAAIAVHPQHPTLYLAASRFQGVNSTLGYAQLGNDELVRRHGRIRTEHGYAYLSLDPQRKFLLGVDYRSGAVDVRRINDRMNGVPRAQVVGSLDEGRPTAHCVLVSPENRSVYISYVKDNNALYQYRFDPEKGTFTALEPKNVGPPAGTGPRHQAYHPRLPITYFSNEQHLGVSVYEMAKSGHLKLRQVCDAVDKDVPKDGVSSSDIVITPDGKYVFAGIRGHKRDCDWVSRYQVKKNGELELLGLTNADKIPWGFALSPDARYLLVTAFQGATLTAYKIEAGGGLRVAGKLDWDPKISDLVIR